MNTSKKAAPAAPAAAGAQGEECAASGFGHRMGKHGPGGSIQCEYCGEAPQPAAADGGVRERARALFDAMLAAPYGSTTMGDIVCAETTCSRLESAWLPILEAALSSHRQAGDAVSVNVAEYQARGLDRYSGDVLWGWKKVTEGEYLNFASGPMSGELTRIELRKLYTAPPPGADLSSLSDIAASMANFADVADACTITEGNAQTAIRAWRNQILALVEKGAGS